MQTLEAIKSRRSIKHFDPEFEIPQEEVNLLLESMLQSPTSFNIQHWRIVSIENANLRQKIRDAAWGQEQVSDASVLLILCADIKAWEKEPKRYWQNAPDETQNLMVPMIHDFYHGKEVLQRDEALRSIGIMAQTAMITIKSMGYDSCPMIGFDAEKVAELIKLPEDHLIGMMLTVGKASKSARPRSGQLRLSEVFFKNTFK